MTAVQLAASRDHASLQRHRLAQAARFMEDFALDALLLSRNEDFHFFSNVAIGQLYWERPFALVVPRAGATLALVNKVAETGVRLQMERGAAWIGAVEAYSEIPRLSGRLYTVNQFARLLQEALEGAGLAAGRIGVDALTPPVAALAAGLPRARVVTLGEELLALRRSKHPSELALMKAAAELGDYAMARLKVALAPGRNLQAVSAAVTAEVMEEAGRRLPGSNFQVVKLITVSGPAGAAVDGDGAPTGAVAGKAEPIVSVVVPRLNGYSVEVHRTFFCGRPGEADRQLFETARRLNEAALSQVYAGNRVSSIDEAVHRLAYAAGAHDHLVHRAGHGIGISTHEPPGDMPFNQRPIAEGEVFSCEPGLYVPGRGGFRIGDVVVAREQPEVLTAAPKGLEECVIE